MTRMLSRYAAGHIASRAGARAGWVGILVVYLAGVFVLLTAWRWWTFAELGAGTVSALGWAPPLGSVLTVSGVLVLPALGVCAVVGNVVPRWRMVVGIVVAGLVLAAMATTVARVGAESRECQNGPASVATRLATGLGLGCLSLIYHPDVDTAGLPTGTVLWLGDTDHSRVVLDPATGAVDEVDNSLYYGWMNSADR